MVSIRKIKNKNIIVSIVAVIAIILALLIFKIAQIINISFQNPIEETLVESQNVYKNTKYGFELTLPKGWEASKTSIQEDVIYDTEDNHIGISLGYTLDTDVPSMTRIVSLYNIYVIPTEDWGRIDADAVQELGHNFTYYFGISPQNDLSATNQNGAQFICTEEVTSHEQKGFCTAYTDLKKVIDSNLDDFKFKTFEPEKVNPATIRFVSDMYSIAFNYSPTYNSYSETEVQEAGDRISVDSQWVQVFQKSPTANLLETIQKTFLKGISPQECFVATITSPKNAGTGTFISENSSAKKQNTIQYAVISFPTNTNPDGPWWSENCGPYATTNGKAYFYYDTRYPDRYYYFSIGQYFISSGIVDEETGEMLHWEETFTILK